MKNLFNILLSILILFVFSSCSKKEDKTTEKDTKKEKMVFTTGFYCEMDGKEWFLPDSIGHIGKSDKDFSIYAMKGDYTSDAPYEDFFFVISSPIKTGEFPLAEEGNQSHVQFRSNLTLTEKKSKDDYDQFWSKSGKLIVTKVTIDRAEGTFEFAMKTTDDPPKVITVKNGKFNMRIK